MVFSKAFKNQQGFTLLEFLLIVAVIVILVGITTIALNPNRQLSNARNAQRQADVTTLSNGVYQYSLTNNRTLPPGITTTPTEICATGASSCAGLVDLSVISANEKYLTSLPKDPQCPTGCAVNGTGYKILQTTGDHITVLAPHAEQNKTISISR